VKILLAAATFATNISGVQRHAFNVVRSLLPQPEIEQLHLVVAPWQRNLLAEAGIPRGIKLVLHLAEMAQSSVSRNLWYYRTLPRIAGELGIDVVHITCPMPINARAFHCPMVVTLHDLYPYEIPMNFGFPKFIFNRAMLQQCLRNSDSIACVSEATSALLRKYFAPSVWRKSIRIYNGVEPEHATAAESPIPSWSGEPFLLCIAQHRRNKNIPLLISVFDQLLRSGAIDAKARLVVIGIRGPESERIRRSIRDHGLGPAVHLLEGLSEAALQWCYRHCAVLVAPSITEGFGLPVAEGLLAGCRIVCSDIAAHREIGDGFCHFVNLGVDADMALMQGILSALQEPKPAPVHLPQLSGPVLAKQYIALYRRLLASSSEACIEARGGSFSGAVQSELK
jgi:glycosyltransferase involved in cell wall biosynthesis